MVIKETRRKIISKPRFFWLITIIISLGIIFYLGSSSFTKSMKLSLYDNYKEINIMDLKLNTNLTFSESDKLRIKNISGVKDVYMSKSMDAIAKIDGNDVKVRLNSISNSNTYINKLILKKGKYPKTINEAVVDEVFYDKNNISLNDLITLSTSKSNNLRAKKVKVVGVSKSNIKDSLNTSNNYMYLNEVEFGTNYYNDVYITVNNNNKIKNIKKELTKIFNDNKEKTINERKTDKEIAEVELNNLYSSTLPQEELSDEIKELTSNLEYTKKELSDAQNAKLEIETKDNIPIYKLFNEDIKNINKAITPYSFIFLLICILVSCLLLISYINKDKKEINSLEKMGYSKIYVYSKYILYLLFASILALIIGIILYRVIIILFGISYKYYYGIKMTTIVLNIKSLIITILSIIILDFIIIYGYLFKNKLFSKIVKYTPIVLFIISLSLIFVGYNLRKNILRIPDKQFNDVFKYNIVITNSSFKVDKGMYVSNGKISISGEDINLVIPQNTNKINKYINLDNKLNNKGIIITNNIAKKLKIKKNDKISLKINNKIKKVKVSGITKNYIDNYVYMSPTLYKDITNEDVYYNNILVINNKKIKNIKNNSSDDLYYLKKDVKEYYKSLIIPFSKISIIFILMGAISFIIATYSCTLLLDNKTNRSYINIGYNKHSLIKKYYKNIFNYPLLIICSIILGNIILLINMLLINNYLFNFKFNFNFSSYVYTILTTIIIILISEIVINNVLKVKKM